MPLVASLPNAALRDQLAAIGVPNDVILIDWDFTGPAPLDAIDLVVAPYLGGAEALRQLANVRTRLVQHQSIGFDGAREMLPRGSVLANAAGVHETSTAELALALVLAAQRRIPDHVRSAERGEWEFGWAQSLADRRVLLVGYGGVNRAVEQRLRPFEVTITRVASRARQAPDGPVHGVDELPTLLPNADVAIVTLPLTSDTERIIDDTFLSLVPDGALVVNMGRGKLADTAAILDHARRGRLRFALDVVEPEPLPSGHPLFALPNVLISPHVGGASSAMLPRMARLVRDQLVRMQRGDPPLNVVLRID